MTRIKVPVIPKLKPQVTIIVQGGTVVGVHADSRIDANFCIRDYDVEGAEPEVMFTDGNGENFQILFPPVATEKELSPASAVEE